MRRKTGGIWRFSPPLQDDKVQDLRTDDLWRFSYVMWATLTWAWPFRDYAGFEFEFHQAILSGMRPPLTKSLLRLESDGRTRMAELFRRLWSGDADQVGSRRGCRP